MRSTHTTAAGRLLTLWALTLAAPAAAQTPYIVSHAPGTYAEVTNQGSTHTPVAYGAFSAWDEGSAAIPMPFSFTWFGTSYSTVHAYTNGFVSFNPPPATGGLLGAPSVVPSQANAIHNFISGMWHDLEGGLNPEIRSFTTGVVGSRTFVVQFRGLQRFSNPASSVNFQIRFSESTNAVQVVFGPNNGITGGSTVMENGSGTLGLNLMAAGGTCTGSCVCPPAGCGSLNWPNGFTITIALPQGPELTGAIRGPRGAYPSTQFDAVVRVQNLGLTDTPAFQYQVRIGSSGTSTQGSTLLTSVNVPALAASSALTATRAVTMPAAFGPGRYWLSLVIDSQRTVPEVLESNNAIFAADTVATAPDLSASLTAPRSSGPGETLPVHLNLENEGAPLATPVLVAFHLSEDGVIGPGDFPLGTALVPLPDGFSASADVDLTVPLNVPPSPPLYRVLARLDDQGAVTELDETNNDVAAGGTTEIVGPDVVVDNLVAGPFAFLGEPYPVQINVLNDGGASARDFTTCLVLSDNLLISLVTDTVLATTPPMTLRPGERATLRMEPVIDVMTSTGSYYVAAVADCGETLLEGNELNNIKRRTDPVVVRSPVPDFVPVQLFTATVAAAGETVPVSVTIGNLGNLAGVASLRVVLSTNPGITVDDRTLVELPNAVNLAPTEESTISVWAALPGDLSSGNYWVGVIADADGLVEEVYEDNNARGAGPVSVAGSNLAIITPNPPNATVGVPYVRRISAVGGAEVYRWSLTWSNGQAPAGLGFDAARAELSGTPASGAEGQYDFTVRVDSGALFAERSYSLIVAQPSLPLVVVSTRLPPALQGEPYSARVIGVGGVPPYRWSVTGSGMPPSGVLLTESGEVSGEPQVVGAYTFEVEVTDAAGGRARGVLAIDVVDTAQALTINTADVAAADVGSAYEQFFQAAGGTEPYSWRMDVPQLIPGLSFRTEGTTGLLAGTATVAGSYPLVVEVRDAKGLIDRNAYVLLVRAAGNIVITKDTLPQGVVGRSYQAEDGPARFRAVQRNGGSASDLRWTLVAGVLPPGLVLDPAQGIISGTPVAEGRYPFRVLVSHMNGESAFAAALIEVVAPADGGSGTEDTGCGCTAGGRAAPSGLLLSLLAGLLLLRRRAWLLAALLGASPASAQVVPYVVLQEPAPFVPLGPSASPLIPGLGDGETRPIPLPFTVYLYGRASTTLYVNANGLVFTQLPAQPLGHHFPPAQLPNPGGPEYSFVAGLWEDWCASAPCGFGTSNPLAQVLYSIDSTPGAASITLEWRDTWHFSDATQTGHFNFQMRFFEGLASRVELNYGPMTGGLDFAGDPTDYRARIGLQDATGANGMWLSPCAGPLGCEMAEIAALTGQRITIVADAGEDVAMTSAQAPAVGYPGLPLPVSGRLQSRHGQPLGPVRTAIHLLPAAATSTAGGRLLAVTEPVTLLPYEGRLQATEVEIPNDVPVGLYRVAFVADSEGTLLETDEGNNVAFSPQVRIAGRAPDFRARRVRALALEVEPGQPIQVSYLLENFGNDPGALEAQLYLSSNEAITTADLALGSVITASLGSRQTTSGTVSATLPTTLATGSYHVGVILDPRQTVAELSESNNVARASQPVTVSSQDVAIVTESLPPATLGVAYSATVRAAGGQGGYLYRLAAGTVPRGVSFNAANAEVFGVPIQAGSFPLTIEVTSGRATSRKVLDLEVLDPTLPLTVVGRDLPEAVLGADYAATVRAVGGVEPYAWRVADGALPPGFGLAPDGTILGTPRQVGTAAFELEVRDNGGATATVALSLQVRPPANLTVVTAELPEALVGESYRQALSALGGSPPYILWRLVEEEPLPSKNNVVPPGLSISSDNDPLDPAWFITGVPERAGRYDFKVEVTDSANNVDTNRLVVEVRATGRLDITTESLPVGQPGAEYRATIEAGGGKRPYTWSLVCREDGIPPDFSPRDCQGRTTADDFLLGGTLPAEEGVWAFTVRVEDSEGRVAVRPLAIVSRNPPPPPVVEEEGCSCTSTPERSPGSLAWLALLLLPLLARRRALALAALLAGWAGPAAAQTYVMSQYGAAYTPIPAGNTISFSGVSTDDGAETIPIGFPFTYYGVTYTHANVGVNGYLSFAPPCATLLDCMANGGLCSPATNSCELDGLSYFNGPLPDNTTPNMMVAPWWDDLNLGGNAGSVVRYQLLGTAPNRELVVEWANMGHYSTSTSRANFQVRLDEASGAVRLAFGPFASAADNNVWTGNIGIEDHTGTSGFDPLGCPLECTSTTLQSLNDQVIEFVVPNAPELSGNVFGPTGADPGATVSIPVTVRNVGPQATGAAFQVEVYLSVDTTITPGMDLSLGVLNFPALGPMTSQTATLSAVIPANTTPGLYTIGAVLDSGLTVMEAVESNNIIVSSVRFLVGYDVTAGIEAFAGSGPGEVVSFPIHLGNNGSALPSVEWVVRLSSDMVLGTGDTLLASGSSPVPALPDNVVTVTATVPTIIPGDYYLILSVDPNGLITEADETNNVAVSGDQVQLRGADVVGALIDGPTLAFPGLPYTYQVEVRNSGLAHAANLSYAVVFSDNQLITISDPQLCEVGPLSLQPGQVHRETRTCLVPPALAGGEYYLGLIADSTSQVLEMNENNNQRFKREKVLVRDPAPDFALSEVNVPQIAAAGESMTFSRVLANLGNAPGLSSYAVYLSDDPDFDASADLLVARLNLDLAQGEEQRGADTVRLPVDLGRGAYYVVLVADPDGQVDELAEDNNVAVSPVAVNVLASQLVVLTRSLPVATLALEYEVLLAASGGAGTYTWSVDQGTLPAGINLDPSGRLSGTPGAEGVFPLRLAVTDGALVATRDFNLLVADQTLPLEVVTRAIPPGFVGDAFEYALTAFGGVPPYTWTVQGNLQAGLSLSPAGVIAGNPTRADAQILNFKVTDTAGRFVERSLALRVINRDAALRFASEVLPDGRLGEDYQATVHVEPGTGASPFSFEHSAGQLPAGLTLEMDQLVGTPTQAGSFGFELRVKDSRSDFDVNVYVVSIHESDGVSFATTSLPKATVGVAYQDAGSSVRIKAISNFGGTRFMQVGGALPNGIILASDGTLGGTPSEAGTFSFLVLAQDRQGQQRVGAFGLVVEEPPPAPTPKPPAEGCGCSAAERAPGPAWASLALVGVLALLLRRRGALLLLLALGAPVPAAAQLDYLTSTFSEPYVARMGNPINFSSLDEDQEVVPLPFPFHFYDTDYTELTVTTNGIVAFGNQGFVTGLNGTIPQTFAPNAFIAPMWNDLVIAGAQTLVEGAAPNRIFILQVQGAHAWLESGAADFQLWLWEGGGARFDVRFGPAIGGTSAGCTAGYENGNGTLGGYLLPCQASCSAADYVAAEGTVFRAEQDAGPDVEALAVSAPQVLYPGLSFDATVTVASRHQNPLGPFVYSLHLVPANQTTLGAAFFTSPPLTLTGFQTSVLTASVSLPIDVTPGRYRLALVVDSAGALAETNENNNQVLSTRDVRVDPRQPDFALPRILVTAPNPTPGGAVALELDVANRGNLAGEVEWIVVLSRNAVASVDDLVVGTGTLALDLLTTQTLNIPAPLPADLLPGVYYVGALVDPQARVAELSELNNVTLAQQTVTISQSSVSVASRDLPLAYVEQDYSAFLGAQGGDGTYRWSLIGGTQLPAGMTLISTTGEIRGSPMNAGSTTLQVQVESGGQMASAQLELEVREPRGAITIVTRELLPGLVADAYPPAEGGTAREQQQHIVATGGQPPYTYAIEAGTVPGLTLEPDGWLHGTPTQRGSFEITVGAVDGGSTRASRSLVVTIGEAGRLTLVGSLLPDGRIGEPYEYQLRVLGHAEGEPLTFTLAGTLPPGMNLSSDGIVGGTPTAATTSDFAVTVVEGAGPAPTDTASFRIEVAADQGFRITPTTVPGAVVGQSYEAVLKATVDGSVVTPPVEWRLEGPTLPRGLAATMSDKDMDGKQDLLIAGIPEEAGFVTVLVRVTDSARREAAIALSINVSAPPPPPPPPVEEGCTCARRQPVALGHLALGLPLLLLARGRARRRPSAVSRDGVIR